MVFSGSMLTMTSKKDISSAASFQFTIALPSEYAVYDALEFHGRDKENVAEQVTETQIKKGVLLADVPAVIDITFAQSRASARCTVSVDGPLLPAMKTEARAIALSILGLRIDPAMFSVFAKTDPVFGPLTLRQPGLRVVQSSSVFEALTWAVMGQQINVSFAISLRRTFIRLAGRVHSSGLLCYPSATDAANVPLEALTSRQFSRSKAETLLRLATLIANGELDLIESDTNTIEQIAVALLAVKGIGPWTVNYAMLRGYAHADCSLHGDVAVRSAIHKLFGGDARPDMAAAEKFLEQYSPHRTMVAAHLWASLNTRTGF
jgi:DNA-3-methyladenine glycosylase II